MTGDALVPERVVLSVGELNRTVASLLERTFPLLWVTGEISNLTKAASGHYYFSLKDREAQVRCVMFRSRVQAIDWPLREGDRVEARVVVGIYAPRGDFQLNVETLRRAGAGALYESFLRLKAKLEGEGHFAPERKRVLPKHPRAIGIVTSLQAAALRDVVATLRRRAPHVPIIIYPTPVQGADAAARIVTAIARASARAQTHQEVDLVLLVRGGGSIEDLWSFNEEIVARAILAASIPIVSGVGHETDFTIADFAADLRAPTPTAAAELATADRGALVARLESLAAGLRRHMERALATGEQRVDESQRRLKSPRQRWQGALEQLASLRTQLMRSHRTLFARRETAFAHATFSLARLRIDTRGYGEQVTRGATALSAATQRNVREQQRRLDLLATRLELLNPRSALARGYAIVTDANGHVVADATVLAAGQAVVMAFERGTAHAQVLKVDGNPAT